MQIDMLSLRQISTQTVCFQAPQSYKDLICQLPGEIELEPEVNLSNFLDRQRISDLPARSTPLAETDDAEDVDPTLAHISSRPQAVSNSKKGQVKQINWDEQLDDLSREKAAAEAARGESPGYSAWPVM